MCASLNICGVHNIPVIHLMIGLSYIIAPGFEDTMQNGYAFLFISVLFCIM